MIMIRQIEGRCSERIAWLAEELRIPYVLGCIAADATLGAFSSLAQGR
jgi:hypothetical protein